MRFSCHKLLRLEGHSYINYVFSKINFLQVLITILLYFGIIIQIAVQGGPNLVG